MLEVDQVRQCKQLHARGTRIRAIARELGISRNTVRNYIRGKRLPGDYRMGQARVQPVAGEIRPVVRAFLETEQEADTPRKQRLTAARIHRLLQGKFTVSEATVRRVVRELRLELRDPLQHAYLPLEYEPGEDAQVDFLEAWVDDKKEGRCKIFVLLVRACYSGRCFAYVGPNQTREALLEGLMQSFEFFGGVFRTLWFDNLTPAVKKVLKGRSRVLQEEFERFQAHYGFEAAFCSPGKGNEKGGVEGEVKFSRIEIFSPIPTVDGREGSQQLADEWMKNDFHRIIRGREMTIGEYWSHEQSQLIPCPPVRFDPSLVRPTKVSPRSWIAFGTNFYSAPVEWVGHPVDVRVSAEAIEIRHRNGESVSHQRLYGSGQMSLVLDHYLPLLERKHRGLDRAVPVRRWLEKAAPCWRSFLRALRQREGEVDGSKAFVEALCLCRLWGREAITEAVRKTLRQEEVSIGTLRYHLWRRQEEETPRPASIEMSGPIVHQRSASEYQVLCPKVES